MRDVITPFVRKSRDINFTVLSIFEARLGLARGELLKLHPLSGTCGGEARCVKTPPNAQQAGIGAHSDFGTLVGVTCFVLNVCVGANLKPVDCPQQVRGFASDASGVGQVALHQGRSSPMSATIPLS